MSARKVPTSSRATDSMTTEERAALERALERSLAQADAGELIEADEVLAELEHRLPAQ